jgi:hypothetical protein
MLDVHRTGWNGVYIQDDPRIFDENVEQVSHLTNALVTKHWIGAC